MLTDPDIVTGPRLPLVGAPVGPSDRPSSEGGLATEFHHVSTIVYAIPGERVRAIVPAAFEVAEFPIDGRRLAWLSITSFLDQWPQPRGGRGAFEQTNYRLHVLLEGEPGHWLLGASLGSLSAVAARQLWPLPWHLSAMEFQVAYDPAQGRYRDYRLQVQSQWSNACWEIEDTGTRLDADPGCSSLGPPSPFDLRTCTDYFIRRDGELGAYRSWQAQTDGTRGKLKVGRCDLLHRLGLLTKDELSHPSLIVLQPRLACRIYSPAILNTSEPSLSFTDLKGGRGRLAFAS